MTKYFLSLVLVALAIGGATPAMAAPALPRVLGYVNVPGHPFQAISNAAGDTIFVSLWGQTNGICVLRHTGGQWTVSRMFKCPSGAGGMALTHNGRALIVADSYYVLFIDVARLLNGDANPYIGYLSDNAKNCGSIYVNATSDDHYLFVSDEFADQITVIDLQRALGGPVSTADIIGTIPVGGSPVALTFSADEKYLYTTSEVAPASMNLAPACDNRPPGAVITIDVAKAQTDPAHAIVTEVPAGCSTVRLVLSPDKKIAYATARESDQLFAFDAAKLISDPKHAELSAVSVGPSLVGVIAVDKRVIVTDSARFRSNAQGDSDLTVLDVSALPGGTATVIGKVPAGSFPREMTLLPDKRTLILTNYNSGTVELIDLGAP